MCLPCLPSLPTHAHSLGNSDVGHSESSGRLLRFISLCFGIVSISTCDRNCVIITFANRYTRFITNLLQIFSFHNLDFIFAFWVSLGKKPANHFQMSCRSLHVMSYFLKLVKERKHVYCWVSSLLVKNTVLAWRALCSLKPYNNLKVKVTTKILGLLWLSAWFGYSKDI